MKLEIPLNQYSLKKINKRPFCNEKWDQDRILI